MLNRIQNNASAKINSASHFNHDINSIARGENRRVVAQYRDASGDGRFCL